jgi:ribosomal protein S18 acetylase RimI-like enzyme
VGDIEGIAKIAAESFSHYGHYSNNEKTRLQGTGAIYEDWARRSCSSKDFADYIVVAELEGFVAGFLSLKIHQNGKNKCAVGVMGAVDQAYRKHGLFRGINVASMHWARKEAFRRIENNVLVTNFPVNKTYISLGFNIVRSETTLHCWLG